MLSLVYGNCVYYKGCEGCGVVVYRFRVSVHRLCLCGGFGEAISRGSHVGSFSGVMDATLFTLTTIATGYTTDGTVGKVSY